MNRLTTAKRVAVVAALVEGNSIRATARITDVSKPTILKLLADLGPGCTRYQDEHLRNLRCRRIQCDEIWQFSYAKQKNVATAKAAPEGAGDVWTWVAIDADTKLVPSWIIGSRDLGSAYTLMHDLAERVSNRIQLTTDGHRVYLEAVESAFNLEIDYAMLQKVYGADPDAARRYSPASIRGSSANIVNGAPNPRHISTSYVERQNLTMRMSMRRFTRLSNGFSKKIQNHAHAVALHFMHYNFARIHRTLRVTPAIEAGISDRVWSLEEIVGLLDRANEAAA